MKPYAGDAGLTLIELVLGALTLTIAIVAILGAYVGQLTLNEHARNLSLSIQDANRVIEQLRQQNAGGTCTLSAAPPAGANSWNDWLDGGGAPKSLPQVAAEHIAVTCQDDDGGSLITDYCGTTAPDPQVGAGEWRTQAATTTFDPIRLTVAVCWRHRERTIGECTWNDPNLTPSDTDGSGVIDSPAMLTTLVTCR